MSDAVSIATDANVLKMILATAGGSIMIIGGLLGIISKMTVNGIERTISECQEQITRELMSHNERLHDLEDEDANLHARMTDHLENHHTIKNTRGGE